MMDETHNWKLCKDAALCQENTVFAFDNEVCLINVITIFKKLKSIKLVINVLFYQIDKHASIW